MSLIKKIFKSKKNKTLNTSYDKSKIENSKGVQSSDNLSYHSDTINETKPLYQDDENSITFVSSRVNQNNVIDSVGKTAETHTSPSHSEYSNFENKVFNQSDVIIPQAEIISTQIQPEKNIIEEQEESAKKEVLARIKPKKISLSQIKSKINKVESKQDNDSRKKELSELTRKEYEERIDKVLSSIVHLLTPFKDILLKNVPSSKYIIYVLEKIGILITFVAKKIFLNVPSAIRFIKSRFFKIAITLSFILFIIGILLSRVLSTDSYKKTLERNIYNATGYEAEINGSVKLSLIPFLAITINQVAFYTDDSKALNSFGISQVSSETLYVRIKFLPLLQGKIIVSEINLNNFNLNIKASSLGDSTISQQYDEIYNTIESKLSSYKADNFAFNQSQVNIPELIAIGNETTRGNENPPVASTHYKKNYDSSNSIDLLMEYLVNAMQFDLNKINSLHLNRGKINFLNQNNQRALSFDNINSSLSKSKNNLEIVGSTLLNGINTDYIIKLDGINKSIVDFNVQMIFDHNDDAIRIKGKMDAVNHIFSGDINSKYSILYLINKFIYPTSTKIYNSQFNAKFNLTPTQLVIKDYTLQIDKDTFNGNFLWDYANNNYIKLDINSTITNLNPLFDNITTQAISENTLFFIGLAKQISLLKNEQVNIFKPNHYDITLNLTNSYLNNVKINNLSLNAILTNNKLIYVKKFELNNDTSNLKMIGKVNLDTADVSLLINSSGDIVNSLKLYGISSQGQDLIDLINTSKDYNLNSLLLFDNSKNYVSFSDINGMFGNIKINNTFLTLKYIDGTLNSTLNIPLETLNINKIENIYKTYITNSSFETALNTNLFGLKDSDIFNLNLNAQKVIYNQYQLENGIIELQFNQFGLKLNKFNVSAKEGGSIGGILTLDTSSSPQIFGSFNFNDLYIDLAKIQGLIFEDKNLVGNFILNGNLKFSNDNLSQILNNVNGSITFIKQERIKFNRFAENSTIYFTITETTDKKKNTKYFLNDVAGQLNIVNNLITIESVGMRYFKNSTEYRGTFEGTYNTLSQTLDIKGAMDNAIDTSKRIEFSGKGNILKPQFNTKSIILRDRLAVQKKEAAKTKALSTELDDNSYYAKSKNATNFRNPYRAQDKETQEERNRLYDELINEAPPISLDD